MYYDPVNHALWPDNLWPTLSNDTISDEVVALGMLDFVLDEPTRNRQSVFYEDPDLDYKTEDHWVDER